MDNKAIKILEKKYNINNNLPTLIELKLQSILESQEKIYSEEMKHFFPAIWNQIKGNIQFLLPIASSSLSSEEKSLSQYIKNLSFEVRINHSSMRNAYTYPWIDSGIKAQVASIPIIGELYYFINGFGRLFKHQNKLDPIPGKGFVSFPGAGDLKVMAFQTKALLTDLSPPERAAVMLHEIGHWYQPSTALTAGIASTIGDINKTAQKSLLYIFPPLTVALFIFFNLISRSAERRADLFAKRCGFGNELASALDRILLRPREDVTWILKVNDWLIKIIMHIQNVLDKVAPFLFNYPSAEKRIAYLTSENLQLENLNRLESFINEGKMKDMALTILKKPMNNIDKIIAPKLKVLFPIK